MTALLLIAGVLIFAMAVAGVWLMQHAEAEPAARAVGRAPDPAEEEEAQQTLSTPRPSILQDREHLDRHVGESTGPLLAPSRDDAGPEHGDKPPQRHR